MTHQEIIDREIVEQYVLDQLSAGDRRIFQEHFFECDDCFQQAHNLSENVTRVRYAAAQGALAAEERRKAAASFSWLRPVLAFSVGACILLAALALALFLGNRRLQVRLAGEEEALRSQQRAQTESENSKREAELKLQAAEAERARLQQQLDELNRGKPSPRPDENLVAQTNLPSVTLESNRDSGSAAQLTIPTGTKTISLLIPVEPGNRFQSFSIEVLRSKAPVATVNGARPNQSGSLSIRVSAAQLESGDYRVRLYGVDKLQRELLAEFDLRVLKK
jgi:hypothetical protein